MKIFIVNEFRKNGHLNLHTKTRYKKINYTGLINEHTPKLKA